MVFRRILKIFKIFKMYVGILYMRKRRRTELVTWHALYVVGETLNRSGSGIGKHEWFFVVDLWVYYFLL